LKIRAKFNLLMLAVTAVGVGLFALAADPLVDAVAREEVLQSARLIMDSAAGARKYTSEQITPLLKQRMEHQFYPQAVSAYGAKRTIDVIEAKYPDYSYREAATNPTNPQDRAADWEADIINDFKANPQKSEVAIERATPTGRVIVLARPLVAKPACLECHSTAANAPKSMIAIYGGQGGFGWKANDVIAAQVVSVPIQAAAVRAGHIRKLFILPFACLILVMYTAVNILLHFVVIRPIEGIAKTAEAVSMGQIETPEYDYESSDEIGRLSESFTRMHRSVVEAFHLLAQA
jgi:HAMP domain-containing protein